jgi:hypothetical protein
MIVYTVTQPAENKNLNYVWSAAWNFTHAGQFRMRGQIRMTLKTPLVVYSYCSYFLEAVDNQRQRASTVDNSVFIIGAHKKSKYVTINSIIK